MVGHLTSPHYLSFSEEDDNSLSHPHNQLLHIEVMIHQKYTCCMLIDNWSGLNIFSTTFLKKLGYSKESIDPCHKITIKAYDEVKHKSLGLFVLPLWVGLVERNVTCQVLDIPLAKNILLGRPWIQSIAFNVPSMHQVSVPRIWSYYTC